MEIKLDEKAGKITITANYDPKGVPQKNGGTGFVHCKAGGGWPVRTGVKNGLGNELNIGLTVLSHPPKKADGIKPMQA
jgi:hypothetical protein